LQQILNFSWYQSCRSANTNKALCWKQEEESGEKNVAILVCSLWSEFAGFVAATYHLLLERI
jgi:hypothetical protein